MISPATDYRAGVGFGIAGFSLFAVLPAYVQLLQPLSGYAVVAQRVIWTSLLLALGLLITMRTAPVLRPAADWRAWPGLLIGSGLVGLQWWLFTWAPLNGRTLELSLGYFLLPVVMVFIGRVFLGERLWRLQKLAVTCAVFGVVVAYRYAGGLSWVVLVVALGWPAYFLLRRYQPLPVISAFFIENLLLLPAALWAATWFGGVAHPFAYSLDWLARFIGLALLGTIPMLCMLAASRRLPVAVFGLLSYLEPVLIFVVALVILREPLAARDLWVYGAFGAALGLMALQGASFWLKRRR